MKEITFILISAFLFTLPHIFVSFFMNNREKNHHIDRSELSFADCFSTFIKNIITSGVFISLFFFVRRYNNSRRNFKRKGTY